MPPPPPAATPSPNRFIFKKPGSKATPSTQYRESGSKVPVTTAPQSAQFAPVPRFSNSTVRTVRTLSYQPRSSPPTRPTFTKSKEAPRPQADEVQDDESPSEEKNDDDMLDDEPPNQVLGAGQMSDLQNTRDSAEGQSPPQSSKRPRLEYSEQAPPSQRPSKSSLSRFIIPSPTSQSLRPAPFLPPPSSARSSIARTSNTGNEAFPRPVFLKPAPPPANADSAITPLPEAFSPHRKGQRYVPGAMAAELSSWVIEVGQAAAQSRRGKGYLYGNDFVREMKVSKVRTGEDEGVAFAEGHDAENEEYVRVMLVVGHESGRAAKQEAKVGDVIGIRTPTWDVEVMGECWVIGADWKILR